MIVYFIAVEVYLEEMNSSLSSVTIFLDKLNQTFHRWSGFLVAWVHCKHSEHSELKTRALGAGLWAFECYTMISQMWCPKRACTFDLSLFKSMFQDTPHLSGYLKVHCVMALKDNKKIVNGYFVSRSVFKLCTVCKPQIHIEWKNSCSLHE